MSVDTKALTSNASPVGRIPILVADDHAAFRRSLGRLISLAPEFEIIANAENGDDAVVLSGLYRPQIVLLDDDMPGRGGIQAARDILREQPKVRVLVLSLNPRERLITAAHRAGAAGCLSKDCEPNELLDALRSAAADLSELAEGSRPTSMPVSTSREPWSQITISESFRPAEQDHARSRLLGALRGPMPAVSLTPSEARALARDPVSDVESLLLAGIARALPKVQDFDRRLVSLRVLDDRGETAISGRWMPRERQYQDLRDILANDPSPALVLLGSPGAGKSTQLMALRADEALAGLREPGSPLTIPFFLSLADYQPDRSNGGRFPDPEEWVVSAWAKRYPEMPPLVDMLESGRLLFLFDGLDEIPVASEQERTRCLRAWRRFIIKLAERHEGSRVVFSCRSLDYSQPLSTLEHPVPQVRIEPLSDEQLGGFLDEAIPADGRVSQTFAGVADALQMLRSPFFLTLFAEHASHARGTITSRAGLISAFVRRSLLRELERGEPVFRSTLVLSASDQDRIRRAMWRSEWDLPRDGVLISKLSGLARAMHNDVRQQVGTLLRLDMDEAHDRLNDPRAAAIVEAGLKLGILDLTISEGKLMFSHRLMQEYFAAIALIDDPSPELAKMEWRAARITPGVDEVIAALPPSDPLPPLPQTGWEEAHAMAVEIDEVPEERLSRTMGQNLALAGRCAGQASVLARLPKGFLHELRDALVRRSRDPQADLRDRIACAESLANLGDPRFERIEGPDGSCLVPPVASIASGRYPIGGDQMVEPHPGEPVRSHTPRHHVELRGFSIGRFAVTNAEYGHFMTAGGYDDPRWWESRDAERWRSGETTADAPRSYMLSWVDRFRRKPELMASLYDSGTWDDEIRDLWIQRLDTPNDELERYFTDLYPAGRVTEPQHWRESRFSKPGAPVVGVCWFEARAYCRWISVQTGKPFRLPSEIEWEAAAAGEAGRAFAWGEDYDPLNANTVDTHIRGPSPVGVFPLGDTPEGLSDMNGNTNDWTLSNLRPVGCWDDAPGENDFLYPYRPDDGREDPHAPARIKRVIRGGYWYQNQGWAMNMMRSSNHPGGRYGYTGFRVLMESG